MDPEIKQKISPQSAGKDYLSQLTQQGDEAYSNQFELQTDYLQRLKEKKKKVQELYSKYDLLLSDTKKKDSAIKQKDQKIVILQGRTKELQQNLQHLQLVHQENKQLISQNMLLKRRIFCLESENALKKDEIYESLFDNQRNYMVEINTQLQQKISLLSGKLALSQQQSQKNLQTERQTLKNQHSLQLLQINQQKRQLRDKLMNCQETIYMLKLEKQCMQQKMNNNQQTYSENLKKLEIKTQKIHKDSKLQIHLLKNNLLLKSQQNSQLSARISQNKKQLIEKNIELQQIKRLQKEQKMSLEEQMVEQKQQMKKQRLYMAEQLAHSQIHIEKLQSTLAQTLKKQSQLQQTIRNLQINSLLNHNLRQIEKNQIHNIHLLLNQQ